jgi:pheromone shutdown protein TraB
MHQASHPDIVMIELDAKRVGKVGNGQSLEELGFLLPVSSSKPEASSNTQAITPLTPINPLRNIVSNLLQPFSNIAQQLAGAVLGKALSQFYASVEKLGFTAGGEFQAAVEEANAIHAKILLGDRDVDVTLQRLAQALSNADSDK